MTVGEALAEARYRAGLTVAEVSERTRIREAVISCIEQDDYEACGGDLYVRGYVRAIAGAIGVDAQPLIRAYDEGRAAPRPPQDTQSQNGQAPRAEAPRAEPPHAEAPRDQPQHGQAEHGPAADAGGDPANDVAVTRVDLPVITDVAPVADPAKPAAKAAHGPLPDPPARPVPHSQPGPRSQPVPHSQPGPPDPPAPASRSRLATWWARPRNRRVVTVVAVVVVLALIVTHDVVDGLHAGTPGASSTASAKQAGTRQSGVPAVSGGTNGGSPAATSGTGAKASAGKKTSPSSLEARAVQLGIEFAMAFGPQGTSDGDNPQIASNATGGGSSQPWQTDWYISPTFDALKDGTGLLLTMDHTYTITSVRIELGSDRGADLQLLAGHKPVFGDLRVVATASDAGGTLQLILKTPVSARYLLIWFTRLPPNGTGRYQASVYRVVVDGVH